jgi:hypothetical protein
MSGYDMQWTPIRWRVKESNTSDHSINPEDILRFEGLGIFHDLSNQLFNETTRPQDPWALGFAYDEDKNKVFDLIRSNTKLVITFTAANNSFPAKLTCTVADPAQAGSNPVTGPTGGTCWVAEAGG